MCQSLYPQEKYPQGHPALAMAWRRLGGVLSKQGQQEQAIRCYGESISIWRQHPQEQRYLGGDSSLIMDLIAVAEILSSEGKHTEAAARRKEAVEVVERKLRRTKTDHEDYDLFYPLGITGTLLAQQGSSTKRNATLNARCRSLSDATRS